MNKKIMGWMVAVITAGTCLASTPWKFGVISDTQWTGAPDDGMSPGTTPAGIIQQCNQAFIAAGVKFVVAVGDTVDTGSQTNMDVRARYAQDLYNAGIGFFPFRGNHESGWTNSAAEEARIYPQIVNGGTNNLTPSDVLALSAATDTRISPVAASGSPFALGANFTYPVNCNGTNINSTYGGLSYAFDYNNVRFVLIDQFENQNPGGNLSSAPLQQPWIDQQLADAGRPQHAFVFDHKNLLGGNHKDNIMGAAINGTGTPDPGDGSGVSTNGMSAGNITALLAKQQAEDAFITTLATNRVHFYISGHDHHHYDSIVKSPLSSNKVHQIISASDSSKFYVPALPASTNDTPVSQDLYKLGYYIYTVDGPRVTVDYYGVDMTTDPSWVPGSSESIITNTPTLTGRWQKILSYGYSLNGQEFVIPQGASYNTLTDSTARAVANGETGYLGTSAQILGGTNASTGTNNYGKAWSKAIDTGWSTNQTGLASDILTLWGMSEIGKNQTDTYVLSMSYNPALVTSTQIVSGAFCLATKDSFNHWVNAVDLNVGGTRRFVQGAWNSSYTLGTYGVDTTAHTVWAVVNHASDFAASTLNEIVNFIYTSDNHYGIVRPLFRGATNVPSQVVNEAMIAKMNTVPSLLFPSDGGVGAGQTVGHVDFLMDTGDLANRTESQSAIAASPGLSYLGSTVNYPGMGVYTPPVSAVTWAQYQHDYLGDANTGNRAGGLLALQDSLGLGIPVFLSPGNHDASDAIGMVGKVTGTNIDASSYCQIYNRMIPYSGVTPITTNVFANPGAYTSVNLRVNYSFNIGGAHVQVVNMFPDKNILNWMSTDLSSVATSTPVLLFCHVPLNMAAGETKVFGNPTNTSSSNGADIPMSLSGVESAASYVDMNAAKQYVADWLMVHPNVKALFSGHDNFNGATNWNGQDPNNNLIATRDAAWQGVTLFRVDSPMKGDISGVSATGPLAGVGNETNLSFQVFSLDVANRRLTEREFLWNNTADTNGGAWSIQSTTIGLNYPTTAAALNGPTNGTVVTNGSPTLSWSAVPGASGYTVTVTLPNGSNAYYHVTGTSLPLLGLPVNGTYSWSVTPYNGDGNGPASASGAFTLTLPSSTAKWSFGVIDDTQWTCADDPAGVNSNAVPVAIINQINPKFIAVGVKFVLQVGDLTENGNDADEAVRAAAAQPLLNAGIGFFPMRGNHETYASPANGFAIPAFQSDYPQTRGLFNTFGAANFSSPTAVSTDLNGMSYTFDYGVSNNNARFLVIDNWVTPTKNVAPGNGYNYGYSIADQQTWISGQLDKTSRGTAHAFVFSHQPLIAENHQDSPFVGNTASNPAMQNAFFASLSNNNVRYYISGHDHIHQRSLIQSPDGLSSVEEIIGASDSSKFYTPKATNDVGWAGQKYRETSLAQEMFTPGYYIYTVDGPRVTVDYYSDVRTNWASDANFPFLSGTTHITPTMNFVKKESFGYALNGQRFLVAQGASYTMVSNSIASGSAYGETYTGTTARILSGSNGSVQKDYTGRSFIRELNTGWAPVANGPSGAASDVLTLWGMADLGVKLTDTYVLSMSYNPALVTPTQAASGAFCLASKDSFGHWVNAVDLNVGGTRTFVQGAWNSSYTLGSYGVDTTAHTVWAVVNHASDFAASTLNEIVNFIYTSDNHYGIVRPLFRGATNVQGQTVNEAMVAKMNTVPSLTFPSDGGVAAGQPVGHVDFLMDTGDIANRTESQSVIAANTNLSYLGATVNYPGMGVYTPPVSATTWAQWQHGFLGDSNTGNRAGGLLTLQDSMGLGIPVFLSPGNHDASDAIGMVGKVTGTNIDASSYVQIYNRMAPYSGKAPIATNVFANPGDYTNVNLRVNYSFDIGGAHVQVVNMFPDKNILNWMSTDLSSVATSTPVLLFCHVPLNMAAGETKVFGNPTNTSSTWAGDIPMSLSGVESATSYVDMNAAKQYVADWLIAHPNVKAMFSGHDNFNGATAWNGQDPNNNLIATRDAAWQGVTLFRVDSPMKGDISGVSATGPLAGIGNETNLSFQVYSLDVANRRLTEREFLWNNTADTNGGAWSMQSTTIGLNFPTIAATPTVPASGASVTNAFPDLLWSGVPGATGYTLMLILPNGSTNYYNVIDPSFTLPVSMGSGSYSWSVTAYNSAGNGPVSFTSTFTLQRPVASTRWSFGVISDTQWTGAPDDGMSPGTTPAGIIQQCNQAFIAAGVKFVVAVGDTVDTGSQTNMDVRARYAQDLYNAGIGFFPFRGNHESGWTNSAAEEARIYPQIVNGGTNNLTPSDVLALSAATDTRISPVAASGSPFALGANFTYPVNCNGTNINSTYGGLSYAFDYNNVRFVLIDQFENQNPGGNLSSAPLQQPWIDQQLADAGRPPHAFVFDHKNLLGGNHKDNIMGAAINGTGTPDPGDGSGVSTNGMSAANIAALLAKQQAEDAFITTLATNRVHFYISGHDHHHYDSIVKSPLSSNKVHQIISASDSSKFYTPALPASTNDTPVSQDLFKLGYYIYTVDGPRVTVDYYGVDMTTDPSWVPGSSESIITNTPTLTGRWQKVLTYGYSLNGQEFVIPQGASYNTLTDSTARAVANGETGYLGTGAQILGGTNASTGTNNYGKAWSKAIDTGWSTNQTGLASDILTLWGMSEIGKNQTDTYVLQLSYNPALVTSTQIVSGTIGMVSKDASSNWVNTVTLNTGGTTRYVCGPYNSAYTLGTYGINTNAGTVWAVVNHASDFAVGPVIRQLALGIVSAHGTGTPAFGTYTNLYGKVLMNAVTGVDTHGGTQYVGVGWSMTGNDPVSGASTNFTMTHTNDAVLTWLWQTNYYLTLAATNGSITNAVAGFQPAGTNLNLYPLAVAASSFDHWILDGVSAGTSVPLNLPMNQPHTVQAVFAAHFVNAGSFADIHVDWTTNYLRGSLNAIVTISNRQSSAKVMLAPIWYEIPTNNPINKFRYSNLIDTNTSNWYIDVSTDFSNQVRLVGNHDYALNPGEVVTLSPIEIWGYQAPAGTVVAVWADPTSQASSGDSPDSNPAFTGPIRLSADGKSVEWDAQSNWIYTVECAADLRASSNFQAIATGIQGCGALAVGASTNQINSMATGSGNSGGAVFYRVKASK